MRLWTLVPVLVLLSSDVADACKCAVDPTVAEALALADAVFVGTVVDQRAYLNVDGIWTGPAIAYDVVVHQAWKGVAQPRVSLRKVGRCDPSFDVGERALFYAGRGRGPLVASGCLRTAPIDRAADDLAQLGPPVLTFSGHARPAATSLPISRRLRAYVVAGVGVYAFHYAQRECESPPWDVVVFPAAATLFGLASVACFVRGRRRAGSWLLAVGVLPLVAHVFWTGHMFLQDEWHEAFLRW